MSRNVSPIEFGRVAVLMGGTSNEREVSLNSGANVLAALKAKGINAHAVDGMSALIEEINKHSVDRVFNVLHGCHGGGEDGVLQGLLQAYGIPCTGSNVLGSAISMDKIRSKQIWISLGLPTPRYAQIDHADQVRDAAKTVGYPLIIKPASEGSSVGVSRVLSENDISAAIDLASRYPGAMLMEQLIITDGNNSGEYTVGILGDTALPSIRIVPAGEYYDYHAKYVSDETQYLCPGLQANTELEMRALALAAFRALACFGWGRVDVMRDRVGKNWLLEVNTAPGMTSHSLFPKAAAAIGINFEDLCVQILQMTLNGDST